MSGAIATDECKDYEWINSDDICSKCLLSIRSSNWVSRVLYGGEKWQG